MGVIQRAFHDILQFLSLESSLVKGRNVLIWQSGIRGVSFIKIEKTENQNIISWHDYFNVYSVIMGMGKISSTSKWIGPVTITFPTTNRLKSNNLIDIEITFTEKLTYRYVSGLSCILFILLDSYKKSGVG